MRLLALDLGTTTGWATSQHIAATRSIQSGSQSFKPGRFEGGGMRFLKMQKWLTDMHMLAGGFHWVCFEEVRNHAGVDAAHAYGGFLGCLTGWCEAQSVPYLGVPVGTIKKSWTGNGGAGKPLMIKIAQAKGFNPVDDNEADALALLHWMFDNEPTRPTDQRPAPDSKPRRRVPLDPF